MRKKVIALITMHEVKNYGSVLQTYATEKIFNSLGYNVIIIDYKRADLTKWGYYFYLPKLTIKNLARNILYFPTKVIQKKVFLKFTKKYYILTQHEYKNEKDFLKYPVVADIYCTGSDQVWNSGWNNGIITEYFLSFVDNKKYMFSYASSFGNFVIPEDEKIEIRKYLKRYNKISVREISAKKILDRMGIDAILVLDPTLMLRKEDWLILDNQPPIYKKEYVLLIQLNRNHKFDKFAVQYSKKHNLELVRLCLRLDQCILPGKHIYIPEVEKYINLINNSKIVLTDSFHAISFCINFNKQFYCVLPEMYSTRLVSILKMFNIQNRVIKNYKIPDDTNVISYEKINKDLNKLREKSYNFIKSALSEAKVKK